MQKGKSVDTGWLDVGLECTYSHRNVFGGDAVTIPAGAGYATVNRIYGGLTAQF